MESEGSNNEVTFDQTGSFFSRIRKKWFSVAALFVLSIGLVITIYQAQKQQEIRQRASGPITYPITYPITFYISPTIIPSSSLPSPTSFIPTSTLTPTPKRDTTPPRVTITYPSSNQLIAPNTTVIIEAAARDNVRVSRVEFKINGVLKCTDSAFPFRCKWISPAQSLSKHQTITAKAYDTSGLTSSYTIKVRIGSKSPQN